MPCKSSNVGKKAVENTFIRRPLSRRVGSHLEEPPDFLVPEPAGVAHCPDVYGIAPRHTRRRGVVCQTLKKDEPVDKEGIGRKYLQVWARQEQFTNPSLKETAMS